MNNSKVLQKLTGENQNQIELAFVKIQLQQIELPHSLFDPSVFIPENNPGLIKPIIVCKSKSGYAIIDGCKRFLQLRKNGVEETIFGIVNGTWDSFRSGALRISLNRDRHLQLREKILYVNWLKENCDDEDYKHVVTELGISDRERFELEQLFDCPSSVMDAVEKGYVDAGMVSDLKSLKEADCQEVLFLLSTIRFTRQQQRELIEWLPEIAFSSSKSIKEVLSGNDFQNIFFNEKINPPQKAQKIRDTIFQYRFPNLVKVKKIWSDLVNKVNPDSARVHFTPSEAFEKNRLEVRINLTEAENAVVLIRKLSNISKETWEKLIYPGKEH